MLNAERVRNAIRTGLEALHLKIEKDDFDEIWDVIIGAIISEITTNGEVVDKDDPTAQIGTIK